MAKAFMYASTIVSLMLMVSVEGDGVADQFVAAHNKVRKEAGVGLVPLKWNPKVARDASKFVESVKNSSTECPTGHSGSEEYGENTFWTQGPHPMPAEVVAFWAAEKQYYSYQKNSCVKNKQCGVYTQIVWNTTTDLGCASILCLQNNDTLVVCNYYPPGNYIGQRPY